MLTSSSTSIAAALLRWHSCAPPPPIYFTVGADDEGSRLPAVGAAAFNILGSNSQAKAAIKRGALLVNDDVVESSRRVREGDILTLQQPGKPAPSASRLEAISRFVGHLRSQGLRTAFEDDHLAVVYKPPGIHTKSGTNHKFAALEDALPAELTPPIGGDDALPLPIVMHRLDVPVSGLCVVAKTRTAALHLARQFEERRVTKTYHALLVGTPDTHRRLIDAPIDGLPSQTEYDILDVTPHPQWGSLASVRMRPKTGRTHQLRVHAAAELGCPIVGDDLYWEAAAQIRPNLPPLRKTGGLFLQSCAVAFEHPDGRSLDVMVAEAAKFGALRARARSGAEWSGDE